MPSLFGRVQKSCCAPRPERSGILILNSARLRRQSCKGSIAPMQFASCLYTTTSHQRLSLCSVADRCQHLHSVASSDPRVVLELWYLCSMCIEEYLYMLYRHDPRGGARKSPSKTKHSRLTFPTTTKAKKTLARYQFLPVAILRRRLLPSVLPSHQCREAKQVGSLRPGDEALAARSRLPTALVVFPATDKS